MTLKKCLALLVFLLLLRPAVAQDTTAKKIREFYLSTRNLAQFNVQLQYKQQLRKNRFFKVSLIQLSYNQNTNGTFPNINKTMNYSGGLQLGLEFRSSLYKRFAFYHGPELGFSSNVSVSKTNVGAFNEATITRTMYNGSLIYTLGLLFQLHEHFYFSAEVGPYVNYVLNNPNLSNYSFSLSSTGALLSLVYRL